MTSVKEGDVDVWYGSIDRPLIASTGDWELLSQDERTRAGRYRFDIDRNRFVAARAMLRRLLSGYLGIDARQIQFEVLPFGKPKVVGSNLEFTVSHSGAYAAYAVARQQVGIDIEVFKPLPDYIQIAQRFFSPSEVDQLLAIDSSERLGAFFRCWTRKEAYIKARGEGLAIPLDSFTVSLNVRHPVMLAAKDNADLHSWTLVHLNAPLDSVGTLAVRAPIRQVRQNWLALPE